jgi:carbamoyltransferase
MRVLGIHDGHNASACLLVDGRVVSCIQEERLTHRKNYMGFPSRSIQVLLEMADLEPEEIDCFALAGKHMPRPSDVVVGYQRRSGLLWPWLVEMGSRTPLYELYKQRVRKERLARLADLGISRDRVTFVDHHTCHAAAAYFGSPFRNGPVLVLTNDGSGDGLCGSVSVGEDGSLARLADIPKGHSIGSIYAQITFLLNFVPWEHEWKLMGLAPYVSESRARQAHELFRNYLEVADGSLRVRRRVPEPTHLLYRRLRRDLRRLRFDSLAAGVQHMTEDLLSRWVRNAVRQTGVSKVALSGGVFMNVKANKAISELEEVEDVFVMPSCGDESNSIGAAYWAYAERRRTLGQPVDAAPLGPLYLGPGFSDADVEAALDGRGGAFDVRRSDAIDTVVAELLANGAIVARCQGRMEFGARALGNRSILADPADARSVRTINMMVKKRDFWMPFAPVVLQRRAADYLVNPKAIASPYMMMSFDTTSRRDELIAAVHVADLTARAQILEESWNPPLYRLLEDFERLTGRGVLLNTSFNLHGYPIVNGPEEALWVMENSDLEYLALGNYLLRRRRTSP